MRHRVSGRRLDRSRDQRKALFRILLTELFRHERIRTTEAKAKAIRSEAERLVTLAKRGDLSARRQVAATLTDETVARKLFQDGEFGRRFANRQGGYTRLLRLGRRQGDGAEMVFLELVD
ncbi:MAG: 50S ribosomal protein L17 [Anaerolineae bacterium]|nr:50S ribosomal protein L17 [Anaerolineae bacterium]